MAWFAWWWAAFWRGQDPHGQAYMDAVLWHDVAEAFDDYAQGSADETGLTDGDAPGGRRPIL